ncbi:MAG: hypothetical protein ACLGPL_09545 [Acidobacteriota bacterium]
MKLQLKEISIILAILVVTLVLNSILSLASFEQLYTESLLSTHGLAGKNLKRYVEQALRLGKPLESFEGMEELLAKVARDNPEISGVGVANPRGEILYHTDPRMVGGRIEGDVPSFDGSDEVKKLRAGEVYRIYVPIRDRSNQVTGIVSLSFSRNVVYRKLEEMALGNLKVLWTLVILVSMGIVLGMALFVTRPLRRRLEGVTGMLEWERAEDGPEENSEEPRSAPDSIPALAMASTPIPAGIPYVDDQLDIRQVRDEVAQLEWHVAGFVRHTHRMMERVGGLGEECSDLSSRVERLEALAGEIERVLASPGLEEPVRADLAALVEESRSAASMLRAIVRGGDGA